MSAQPFSALERAAPTAGACPSRGDIGMPGDGGSRRESRTIPLPRADWLALARERTAAGAHVWIVVRGASMAPSIPAGAHARLSALAASGPDVGDVVLAVLPTGLPVLHRVEAVGRDHVALRGDAMPRRDPQVTRDAVLALVTAVRVGGQERPVPPAPRWRRLRWWRAVLVRLAQSRMPAFAVRS